MRKTFVTAVVALLAVLALASCDNIQTGQNGDGLVTLSVNTGGTAASRSLLDALARDEANYMEVIFMKGSDYYRAQGAYGSKLRVMVPEGTYGPGTAIILIGRYSDGTLLATGVPDASINVPTDLEITFNVTSLVADISTAGTAFVIDESTVDSAFGGETRNGILIAGMTNSKCFQVSTNSPDIEASLTISGFSATGADIIVNGTPAVIFTKNMEGSPDIEYPDLTVTSHADTDAIGATGKIEFKFTTTDKGKYIITFEIPVVGFSADASAISSSSAPLTWIIRGGTEEGQPDYFGANTSLSALYPKGDGREGVGLLVKDDPSTVFGVVVKPSW